MTATLTPPTEERDEALVLHFGWVMDADEFYDFCMRNEDLNVELSSEGDLIIMPPTGMKTGNRNFRLNVAFGAWAEKDGTGLGFDSSSMFSLPNGAKRSPDLSWIKKERWEALSEKEREKFSPICPDFVVELRSPSDSLKRLRKKMEEYVENGAQLGWLLDPSTRKVYVYRPGAEVEVLEDPEALSGEPLLRGFTLDVPALWE
ncbi:MAG TPA: Uma2 family endonuclease [Pyrinomonadaceae bacterium]|jgi:Uma2 family endonuclease|nr:Uma2 family endonuclease [Pyrinomonadaceae bacterium]